MVPAAPTESAPSTEVFLEPEAPAMPPETVNKPTETTPAPTLPPEPAPLPTEPIPTEPMPTEPMEDLFDAAPAEAAPPAEATPPATEAPAEESTDLFGTPAEEPVTPPATEAPAETPAETPAEPATDDLFGTEPTPPAESTTPAETPAETETPATEEAGSDLFGDPAGATEAPATDSAPAEESSTPAEDGADLFGPSTDAAPAEDVTPASNEEAAEEEPATEEPATEEAAPFGATDSILREPGGLASMELREWVDNTGRFSCTGRLVNILDGQARLMKDNGRTTTVPLYRLSVSDLAFLHRQASAAQPRETFAHAANGEVTESLSAN
jgi:hypothetical protein